MLVFPASMASSIAAPLGHARWDRELSKRDVAGTDGAQFAVREPQQERAVAGKAVEPARDERPVIAMDRERGADRMGAGKPAWANNNGGEERHSSSIRAIAGRGAAQGLPA